VHVPGLIVIMPSTPYAAKGLLKAAIRDDNPVVFLEPRVLYGTAGEVPEEEYVLPIGAAVVRREGSDVTIVATGRMVGMALSAAERLSQDGVEAEVIDPQTLKPLDTETILHSVRKTSRLVVVNEGCRTCGYASEISATIAELAIYHLDAPIQRVTSRDVPMPVSKPLEAELLPNEKAIVAAVKSIVT
jgi:pyruvate/2-oxoglutarate/acetoin dehydrogenase E1 component